jgi:hypothetical protein
MIEALEPQNRHEILSEQPQFTVRSRVDFPEPWKMAIEAVKSVSNLLGSDTAPYLEMQSTFSFLGSQEIRNSAPVKSTLSKFDVSAELPAAVLRQVIYPINQVARYGSITTLLYPHGDGQTLVYVVTVFGLEKDVLAIGSPELGLTGEMVLLGQHPKLNSPTGIGSGLPHYTQELFVSMAQGLAEEL